MPAALPTQAELHAQLQAARAELIDAEDADDTLMAALHRARCDAILDRLLQHRDTA